LKKPESGTFCGEVEPVFHSLQNKNLFPQDFEVIQNQKEQFSEFKKWVKIKNPGGRRGWFSSCEKCYFRI
jgi:hypothetical protein